MLLGVGMPAFAIPENSAGTEAAAANATTDNTAVLRVSRDLVLTISSSPF
jgi:hypothetical protein